MYDRIRSARCVLCTWVNRGHSNTAIWNTLFVLGTLQDFFFIHAQREKNNFIKVMLRACKPELQATLLTSSFHMPFWKSDMCQLRRVLWGPARDDAPKCCPYLALSTETECWYIGKAKGHRYDTEHFGWELWHVGASK